MNKANLKALIPYAVAIVAVLCFIAATAMKFHPVTAEALKQEEMWDVLSQVAFVLFDIGALAYFFTGTEESEEGL